MHHNVAPEIKELCAGIRQFIEREVLPMEDEHRELIEAGEVNQEFFDLCADVMRRSVKAGYFALYMPEDVGGGALGEYEMCLVREEVARQMSHLCMLMLGDLPFGPNKMLYHLASEGQREKYLMPLMRGEVTSAIALTEPDAGSDLAAIRTSAKRVEGGYVINGMKHFISNAPYADFLHVLAKSDGGYSMFLADKGTYRVGAVQHSMGGDDIQAEVYFDDSFVPEENLIGEEGKAFHYAMEFLGNERLTMAPFSIGMAELANRLAKQYAKDRIAFGKPIIENQAIQWMIADNETELYAGRAMTYDAAQRADAGENVFKEISMAKLYCTEMVGRVVDRAVQIFGGAGYMKGNTVERLYRLCRVMRIAGGSSEIQRMIIARS
ncbi:MAG: acyl-CoA dehydrogenase [Actinobacteria bacterium]|nr:MAG: acyl-CoA dehydrogenase [Actinomycetota bacterium]